MFYCGLDVSLKQTALCVVDGDGRIVREAKLPTDPEVIGRFLDEHELRCERIGVEAGGTSSGCAWSCAGSGIPRSASTRGTRPRPCRRASGTRTTATTRAASPS